MQPSISVGVLCYNESGAIATVLQDAIHFLNENNLVTAELLVVDDGSIDNSVEIVEDLAKTEPRIRLIKHQKNLGIGEALRTLFHNFRNDIFTYIPGDRQFDIRELQPWLNIQIGEMVNLYRVENTSYNFFRNGLSWLNKNINRYLVGLALKDVNWILVLRREDIQRTMPLQLHSSIVTSEVCAKLSALGCKVLEAPSKYLPRETGKSRGASFKIIFKAAKETIRLMIVIWQFKIRNKKQK